MDIILYKAYYLSCHCLRLECGFITLVSASEYAGIKTARLCYTIFMLRYVMIRYVVKVNVIFVAISDRNESVSLFRVMFHSFSRMCIQQVGFLHVIF